MQEFRRITRLPPYIFSIIDTLKMQARREGEDIIDLGMGNPDLPTPQPVVDKLIEAVQNPKEPPLFGFAGNIQTEAGNHQLVPAQL